MTRASTFGCQGRLIQASAPPGKERRQGTLRTAGTGLRPGCPPLGSRSPRQHTSLSQDSLRAGHSCPRADGGPPRRPHQSPSSTPTRLLHDLPPSKIALQGRVPLGPQDPGAPALERGDLLPSPGGPARPSPDLGG